MASRRKTSDPPPQLHELEEQVMEEVWARGEATVRDVLDELNRRHKKRAYTTVMTIMNRLDEKGLLERTRQGRADLYRPTLSREAYRAARAKAGADALIDQLGDVALAQFAERVEKLDAKRLRELRTIARGE